MNLRTVLRTYTLLRQLTDDESALLNTLRALNDTERELLVESLSPEKPTMNRRGASKSSRQVGKSSSKSSRASSLSSAVQQTAKVKTKDSGDEFLNLLGEHDPCMFRFADGQECQAASDANVHHLRGVTAYHEFTPGKSPAPPVAAQSSSKKEAYTLSVPNSSEQATSAGVAAGGSGERST